MAEKKAKHNTGSTVWHYYTGDGRLIRRRLQPGAQPEAHWTRGFGPHSPEIREKIAATTREHHLNKVVSAETRERMSQAARGRPKSIEHRISMSIAQRERHRRRREQSDE